MDCEKDYSRVLIINAQSMYKNNATGITLQSLWSGWDANCLLEVHSEQEASDGQNHKMRSYCIPPSAIMKLAKGNAAQAVNNGIKADSIRNNRLSKIKSYLRELVVCALDSFQLDLDESVLTDIKKFKPQIIYTLGASIAIMRLVNQLSDLMNIPVVLHFMDNWSEYIQWENNLLLVPYKHLLKKEMMGCLKRCKLVITISPSMAKAYQKKFNKECLVLMNTVDTSQRTCSISKTDEITHFVYAGGLHLDRWKALKDIACSIFQTSGNGILDIYTSENNRKLYQKEFDSLPVMFHNAVPHEQVEGIYSKADVLIHTEIESEQLKGYFKYSISTKIPEYLATAKPILFYGPKDMKLFEYLSENQVALTAGTKEELKSCVERLLSEEDFTQMGLNARCLAKKKHDRNTNQNELRVAIQMCVNR